MTDSCEEKGRSFWPYVMLGAAVLYAVSPIDLIPDVPVVGWIDDISLLLVTSLNVIEKNIAEANSRLQRMIHVLKWSFIVLGVLLTLILGLFGVALVKYISS